MEKCVILWRVFEKVPNFAEDSLRELAKFTEMSRAIYEVLFLDTSRLCFDTVGWAAGRASGL